MDSESKRKLYEDGEKELQQGTYVCIVLALTVPALVGVYNTIAAMPHLQPIMEKVFVGPLPVWVCLAAAASSSVVLLLRMRYVNRRTQELRGHLLAGTSVEVLASIPDANSDGWLAARRNI